MLFLFLATLQGTWILSSPTRDQTCAPCRGSMKSEPEDRQGSPGHSSDLPSCIFQKPWLMSDQPWDQPPSVLHPQKLSHGFQDTSETTCSSEGC